VTTRRSAFAVGVAIIALGVMTPSTAQAQFSGFDGLLGKVKTAKNAHDALRSIPEDEEIKIGGNLAAMILGAAPLANNPAEQRYVNRLGRWLALHCERPGLPWKFGVIDSTDVNAFSTPGGYVLISQGLFDRTRNESELAGVLAHEISHVVRKHHLKALQRSMGNSVLGDIGQSFASSQGSLSGELTSKLINNGKELFIRGLDKNDEYEADRMGVVIAARSGYSPYGLVGVLQTLSAAPTNGAFALMYATHPSATDRIERLDSAMGTRFEGMTGLTDDLPSFVALRNPPPPPLPKARLQRRRRN